jgi:hypothetical protein
LWRVNPVGASFAAIQNTLRFLGRLHPTIFKKLLLDCSKHSERHHCHPAPHRRDVWYVSERATVASYAYQTFGRLDEWRTRVADLTGYAAITDSQTGFQTVEAAFNSLLLIKSMKFGRNTGLLSG